MGGDDTLKGCKWEDSRKIYGGQYSARTMHNATADDGTNEFFLETQTLMRLST